MYVLGDFTDPQTANDAFQELLDGGFRAGEISVLVPDAPGPARVLKPEEGSRARETAALGGTVGAALGAAGAGLAATGVLAGPGIPVLASGPLWASLEGAAAGAGLGGLAGALTGLGIDDDPELPARALAAGRVVLAVLASGDRAQQARKILQSAVAEPSSPAGPVGSVSPPKAT